jgi:membrane fusion protein (multidrug efflux system)
MIYIVDSKGLVKSREVKVMDQAAGENYVVTAGLTSGDKVVAEGMGNLKDSVTIKPVLVKSGAQQ